LKWHADDIFFWWSTLRLIANHGSFSISPGSLSLLTFGDKNIYNTDTQPPDKILKLPYVIFLALIWEIYMQNFSTLTLKLREEFEVTGGWHIFPKDPLQMWLWTMVIFPTLLAHLACSLLEIKIFTILK